MSTTTTPTSSRPSRRDFYDESTTDDDKSTNDDILHSRLLPGQTHEEENEQGEESSTDMVLHNHTESNAGTISLNESLGLAINSWDHVLPTPGKRHMKAKEQAGVSSSPSTSTSTVPRGETPEPLLATTHAAPFHRTPKRSSYTEAATMYRMNLEAPGSVAEELSSISSSTMLSRASSTLSMTSSLVPQGPISYFDAVITPSHGSPATSSRAVSQSQVGAHGTPRAVPSASALLSSTSTPNVAVTPSTPHQSHLSRHEHTCVTAASVTQTTTSSTASPSIPTRHPPSTSTSTLTSMVTMRNSPLSSTHAHGQGTLSAPLSITIKRMSRSDLMQRRSGLAVISEQPLPPHVHITPHPSSTTSHPSQLHLDVSHPPSQPIVPATNQSKPPATPILVPFSRGGPRGLSMTQTPSQASLSAATVTTPGTTTPTTTTPIGTDTIASLITKHRTSVELNTSYSSPHIAITDYGQSPLLLRDKIVQNVARLNAARAISVQTIRVRQQQQQQQATMRTVQLLLALFHDVYISILDISVSLFSIDHYLHIAPCVFHNAEHTWQRGTSDAHVACYD